MSRAAALLRLVCFGLLALIAAQTVGLVREGDPLTEPSPESGPLADRSAASEAKGDRSPMHQGAASAAAAQQTDPPASLPERFKTIDACGMFGKVPVQKIVPTLIGMAGKYAILQTPDGAVGLVAEGGQQGDVKVIKIDINRALIEFEGKQQELTLFSGLGSGSLLPQEKDKKP